MVASSSESHASIMTKPKKAEQGARANAGSCHAACDRRYSEMKNPNAIPRGTRRASSRRGSSLTLAKTKAAMRCTQGEIPSSDAARLSRIVVQGLRVEARAEIAFDARTLGFAASESHAGSHSMPAGWTKFRSPRLSHGAGTQVILSRMPRLRSGQQGARANAGTCHASCDGMCFRHEATEWKS